MRNATSAGLGSGFLFNSPNFNSPNAIPNPNPNPNPIIGIRRIEIRRIEKTPGSEAPHDERDIRSVGGLNSDTRPDDIELAEETKEVEFR